MKIKIFSILLLIIFNVNHFAQKNNIYKSVSIDTTKIISKAEFIKIANKFYQDYYNNSYGEEKFFIDQQIKKLDTEENDKLKIAKGLSSTAVFLTGTGESQNIPLVFSAKAAALFPQDTIIVNNFGAILRMLDSIKASLKVLLYAKSLCPNAPVILTNLGNSLFELYDDKSAEYFFQKALKVNPNYALAHHGLVSVYLKRKDLRKAMEELFKGVAGIYSETLKDVQNQVKYQDSYEPPSNPPGQIPEDQMKNQSSDNQSPSDRQANLPNDKLQLPDFPNWSEEAALINDQSISRFKKEIQRLNSEATDNLFNEADAIKKMNKEQLQNWYDNKMKSGKVLNDKNKFMMDMLGEYYKDQLDRINKNYIKDDKINSEKFDKSLQQISSSFQKKLGK